MMLRRLGVSRKWALTFDAVVFSFSMIGLVQLFMWLTWFDRTLPLKVHFRVIQTISVHAGEPFEYLNFFTRTKYCDTTVQRWFITADEQKIDIASLPSFMPTEALNIKQVSKASITVPRHMPFGVSKSCFQTTWVCNPIQEIWPLHGPETCLEFIVKGRRPQSYSPIPALPVGGTLDLASAPYSDGN